MWRKIYCKKLIHGNISKKIDTWKEQLKNYLYFQDVEQPLETYDDDLSKLDKRSEKHEVEVNLCF